VLVLGCGGGWAGGSGFKLMALLTLFWVFPITLYLFSELRSGLAICLFPLFVVCCSFCPDRLCLISVIRDTNAETTGANRRPVPGIVSFLRTDGLEAQGSERMTLDSPPGIRRNITAQ